MLPIPASTARAALAITRATASRAEPSPWGTVLTSKNSGSGTPFFDRPDSRP